MPDLKLRTTAVTGRQKAMIAALGVVLVGAIAWPNGDVPVDAGGDPTAVAPARAAGERPRARPSPPAKAKQWPAADLAVALSYDPFSSPLFAAQTVASNDAEAEPADEHADLLALQQDGVNMIVRDEAGMVATVGDRKLRVGDTVDGYRVVAIEMDGVVLEPVKSE